MALQLGVRATVGAGVAALASGSGADWYPYGATNWATSVSGANAICKDGSEQSPIDFPTCGIYFPRSLPAVDWKTQPVELGNNGHTVQLTPPSNSDSHSNGKMVYEIAGGTRSYSLVQCHFHYGSEHFIGGMQQDFEAHCVHSLDGSDQAQRYGVFGVFFEADATNDASSKSTFLEQFENSLPPASRRLRADPAGVSFNVRGDPLSNATKRRLATMNVNAAFTSAVDFTKLLDDMIARDSTAMAKYWNYDGSFTTPPCTEAVDFYIYMTKARMTQSQLGKFQAAIGWNSVVPYGNFRPPQPIKNRAIYGCGSEPLAQVDGAWYPYKAENWATRVGLNSHASCDGGSAQSPIDFAKCLVPEGQSAIAITWANDQKVKMTNNGHTVVISVADSATSGEMTANGKAYRLLQCHFHWGSEHTVGGMQYPFEVHCVHQQSSTLNSEAPHYGVFGMFYELGEAANPWLSTIEDSLPAATSRRLVVASELLEVSPKVNLFGEPMDRRLASGGGDGVTMPFFSFKPLYGENPRTQFWNYGGSFTTPPCTEAVDFYIMMTPAVMTNRQLAKFKVAIGWTNAGGNFRPPQPLHSRVVAGCARLSTMSNLLEDQSSSLTEGIKAVIESTVSEEMAAALDDKQGMHSHMLAVLMAVAVLMIALSLAMLAMMFKIMKGPAPSAASSVPPQSLGQAA